MFFINWARLYHITISYILLYVFVHLLSPFALFPVPSASYQNLPGQFKIKTHTHHYVSAVFYSAPSSSPYVILYSHGNAEDLGNIQPYLKQWPEHGFSVLGYDYSGYGTSTGQPSEKNTYRDIEAAYHYLVKSCHIPPNRIIAYGRSLGSGPTLKLAQDHPLAGVIIEGGFVNPFRVITYLPIFPNAPYQNLDRIKTLQVPVFIIHAQHDRVVHHWHGRALYLKAPYPKFYFWAPQGGHNDLITSNTKAYWAALDQFRQFLLKNTHGTHND